MSTIGTRRDRAPSFPPQTVVAPENSIRVAYRTSGVIAPGFYSLAIIADSPCAGVTCAGDRGPPPKRPDRATRAGSCRFPNRESGSVIRVWPSQVTASQATPRQVTAR